MGRFVLRDAVYYSNREYEDILRKRGPGLYEKYTKLERGKKADHWSDSDRSVEEILLDLPSRVKNREISISVHYFDCVAFSIIVFGLGLGFLLLGKKENNRKEAVLRHVDQPIAKRRR